MKTSILRLTSLVRGLSVPLLRFAPSPLLLLLLAVRWSPKTTDAYGGRFGGLEREGVYGGGCVEGGNLKAGSSRFEFPYLVFNPSVFCG